MYSFNHKVCVLIYYNACMVISSPSHWFLDAPPPSPKEPCQLNLMKSIFLPRAPSPQPTVFKWVYYPANDISKFATIVCVIR